MADQPVQQYTEEQIHAFLNFETPQWSSKTPAESTWYFRITKNSEELDRVSLTQLINSKSSHRYCLFGSQPYADCQLTHESISRVHCLLTYKAQPIQEQITQGNKTLSHTPSFPFRMFPHFPPFFGPSPSPTRSLATPKRTGPTRPSPQPQKKSIPTPHLPLFRLSQKGDTPPQNTEKPLLFSLFLAQKRSQQIPKCLPEHFISTIVHPMEHI